jgi:hypothetical protein
MWKSMFKEQNSKTTALRDEDNQPLGGRWRNAVLRRNSETRRWRNREF